MPPTAATRDPAAADLPRSWSGPVRPRLAGPVPAAPPRRAVRAVVALLGVLASVLLPVSLAAAAPATVSPGEGIERYAPYQGQDACDPTAKPGAVALRDLVLAAYPDTGDSGIVRACNVGGTSEHKEGRAWDWRVSASDPQDVEDVEDFFAWLLGPDEHGNPAAMARRLGVMYVIWDSQIWKSYQADRGWQPYSGASPHTDHVHVSLGWAGALAETSYWTGTVAPVRSSPLTPTASASPSSSPRAGATASASPSRRRRPRRGRRPPRRRPCRRGRPRSARPRRSAPRPARRPARRSARRSRPARRRCRPRRPPGWAARRTSRRPRRPTRAASSSTRCPVPGSGTSRPSLTRLDPERVAPDRAGKGCAVPTERAAVPSPGQSVRTAVVWEVLSAVLAEADRAGDGLQVVDAGGGTGGFAVPLAAAGHRVTVVDPSPDSLAALQRRAAERGVADRVTALQGDLSELPGLVPAGSADLLLCHSVLEVVDDPAEALGAAAGVLRTGGRLSLLAANRAAAVLARALAGHPDEAARVLTDPAGRWGTADGVRRRFDAAELEQLVTRAGLVVEQLHGVRVVSDLVPGAVLDAEPAALLALERVLSERPPFRDVATQLHLLALRR